MKFLVNIIFLITRSVFDEIFSISRNVANEMNVKVEISDEDETSRVNLKRLGSTLEESSEHKINKLARKEVETVEVGGL